MTEALITLTPLERLQLRELLQDRWREQVRCITELSVDLHAALDDADEELDIDAGAVAVALSESRLRLVEIEEAMRRLDERTYGRCIACLVPLSYTELAAEPDARHCRTCRQALMDGMTLAVADAG